MVILQCSHGVNLAQPRDTRRERHPRLWTACHDRTVGTRLVLQAPGSGEGSTLAVLLSHLRAASGGGGIFAWTNRAGIASLFDNPVFESFVAKAPFDLVVGTDSITDPPALLALQRHAAEKPLLSVKAFVHDTSAIFHPKICWFDADDGLHLIVGSSNLTRGGLQANWEAFTESILVDDEADAVRSEIAHWMESSAGSLLPLDDARVLEAVEANQGDERSIRQRRLPSAPRATAPAAPRPQSAKGDRVLIAEIPKNRKFTNSDSPHFGEPMFSQANFSREIFESFFGIRRGVAEVLLYHVNDDGDLGELESREGKYKPVSRNYYFELGAARGVPHSGSKPPIGVFLGLESGAYLYVYRLPGQDGYEELDNFLTATWTPRRNQGRRVVATRAELHAAWPGCPLLEAAEPGF